MVDVALFGAAGYSGLELAKILAVHPGVRLACAASDTQAGKLVEDLTQRAHGDLAFVTTEAAKQIAARCEIALLAVPPEAAKELAAALPARIVDLSHAHRATPGVPYGLTSLFAPEVRGARLVANPGCYATAVITAAAPLVREGLVEGDVVVCAHSGVTGAGRQAVEAMSLGELYGEVRAYKVLRHQHVPEIEMALGRLREHTRVTMTTHLLPIARGIFGTLSVRLTPNTRDSSTVGLTELYRKAYADDPTVVIARSAEDVSLRKIVGTNLVMVGIEAAGDRAVITVAIDNLLKGAAGQAIENMNLMLGLPRTMGLTHLARHL